MILEFRNVTGKKKGFHIEDISFALEEGYLMGTAGKNGAGKTTLMNMILDETEDYDGEILVCGQDNRSNRKKLMNDIGFICDENQFIKSMNASENVWLFSTLYDNWSEKIFENIMEQMNLPRKTRLENLSRGEYIKFQITFDMAHDTKLYLIDEATAGMDIVFRKEFFMLLRDFIKDERASIVMTSHIREELDVQMDYILRLEQGKMVRSGENLA